MKQVEKLWETPNIVATLEEIVDENHVIVSQTAGVEYYVPLPSFVDRTYIEPG